MKNCSMWVEEVIRWQPHREAAMATGHKLSGVINPTFALALNGLVRSAVQEALE